MEYILGIDLGTTNSVVSIIREGKPLVLPESRSEAILPSVVGLDSTGRLLVGQEARNQALLAPERTVKSIKRQMGQAVKVRMGSSQYTPQEISAMILRTLKQNAERALGFSVTKAVITVPALFNENQRAATREAGELAGLEVVRIINEPTAAALTYEPHSHRHERLLVYDLGGGTFDVSVVQMESGVVEVLTSHGDTHLGGDDFDQLLLDYVCDAFQDEHGIDLRSSPVARSRLLQAVEAAKIRLSSEAYTTLAEEFIAEQKGRSLNLSMDIDRDQYEELIGPLLSKTLRSVDAALDDAGLTAAQIDRVILVGGSTRTPLVHRLLREQLGHEPHLEVDPDLCVSLGAAVQGGLIAGVDVGPVLVDITPHTLGIACIGLVHGVPSEHAFSPIIKRNTPLPATKSESYTTSYDGQSSVVILVLQGENEDAEFNQPVGEFMLEGLDEEAEEGNEILVRFHLNLDGILTVTAVERRTGLERQMTIDNAIVRFRASSHDQAKAKLESIFVRSEQLGGGAAHVSAAPLAEAQPAGSADASVLVAKARRLLGEVTAEDAQELRDLIERLQAAQTSGLDDQFNQVRTQLEDLLFYLHDD